jgi:hypothetical protein
MRLDYIPLAMASVFSLACGGARDGAATDTSGAATTANAAAAPRDACALLPASDLEAVVGQPVRDSLALSMTGPDGAVTMSQCNYSTSAQPALVSVMLRKGAPAEAGSAPAAVRRTLTESGVTPEDVAGLGQSAVWGGNQLHVFTATGWSIVVTPVPSAGLAQARTIAERALARLPTP